MLVVDVDVGRAYEQLIHVAPKVCCTSQHTYLIEPMAKAETDFIR